MWNDALWLRLPDEEIQQKKILQGDMTGRFVYFRCELTLPKALSSAAGLTVDISANSRYRLWVNGQPVLSGPCKGDTYRQYYETVELTDYLYEGKNVFAAQVLFNDPSSVERQTDERAAIYGVIGQPLGHRFAIEGDVLDAEGHVIATLTSGHADWRVYLDNSFYLKSTDITEYLGAVTEEIDFSASPALWKTRAFDASLWRKAEPTVPVVPNDFLFLAGVQPRFRVREREIPLLFERETCFEKCFELPDGSASELLAKGEIMIPARDRAVLILDAGEIQNGYPRYPFQGGDGAVVTMTYFEKFGGPGSDLRRDDWQNGEIIGLRDCIHLSGETQVYEPFWMRCFRFVKLEVQTAAAPLVVGAPVFRRTGYPMEAESFVRSSAPWVEKLWKVCVNTLQNCMMETYMDCPFYEQLQFTMDTRLEALFTYAVSRDARLVKKALIDCHYGMQPEGITAGKYPSAYLQILSSFSLHYIFMLREYYDQTGDEETVRLCRGDVDRILDYYDAHLREDGLLGRVGFWEFVDWQAVWADNAGMPNALREGPSTIMNLMYAYALGCGEVIFRRQGRRGLAEEYAGRRAKLLERIRETCYCEEKGLYREGPAFEQYTQHAQAWAVLNGLTSREEAKALLMRALNEPGCLKVTFSTAYEWFRALEYAGMEDEMRRSLEAWIALLDLDCTACPETPTQARSDCHAWSALPMYEMIRTMAGIREQLDGTIEIKPRLLDLPDLCGQAVTKAGIVRFDYKRIHGKLQGQLELPENCLAVFRYPDGTSVNLSGGAHFLDETVET